MQLEFVRTEKNSDKSRNGISLATGEKWFDHRMNYQGRLPNFMGCMGKSLPTLGNGGKWNTTKTEEPSFLGAYLQWKPITLDKSVKSLYLYPGTFSQPDPTWSKVQAAMQAGRHLGKWLGRALLVFLLGRCKNPYLLGKRMCSHGQT